MDSSDYDNLTTTVLSISSKSIKNCKDVTNTLLKCGIISSITPNYSINCNKKECWIENGCSIILSGIKPEKIEEKIWNPLKGKFNLNCGHLNIHGKYIGCILNYLQPSKCNDRE